MAAPAKFRELPCRGLSSPRRDSRPAPRLAVAPQSASPCARCADSFAVPAEARRGHLPRRSHLVPGAQSLVSQPVRLSLPKEEPSTYQLQVPGH